MKDYLENGLEIFDEVFGGYNTFEKMEKYGEYQMTDEFNKSKKYPNWYKNCYKAKLVCTLSREDKKKYKSGSYAYVYLLNRKEIIYIGKTDGDSRLSSPSSVGAFDKVTNQPKGPALLETHTHGKTNVKLFFYVNELVRKNDKIEVFIIKAKDSLKLENRWTTKVDTREMEFALLDEFIKVHGFGPKWNDTNDGEHYNF
tara:strand:+ start:69 stop:665 length:597 start_codon:yes stop_codon:yes gene_type:complete